MGEYQSGNGKVKGDRTKKEKKPKSNNGVGKGADNAGTGEGNGNGKGKGSVPETDDDVVVVPGNYTGDFYNIDENYDGSDSYWEYVDDSYIVNWSTDVEFIDVTVTYNMTNPIGCQEVGNVQCLEGQTPDTSSGAFICTGVAIGGCPLNALSSNEAGLCVCEMSDAEYLSFYGVATIPFQSWTSSYWDYYFEWNESDESQVGGYMYQVDAEDYYGWDYETEWMATAA